MGDPFEACHWLHWMRHLDGPRFFSTRLSESCKLVLPCGHFVTSHLVRFNRRIPASLPPNCCRAASRGDAFLISDTHVLSFLCDPAGFRLFPFALLASCTSSVGLAMAAAESPGGNATAMARSYKQLKEDFVSNLSGGPVAEIAQVCAVAPV